MTPPVLIADLFPVNVSLADGVTTLTGARMFLSADRVWFYIAQNGEAVEHSTWPVSRAIKAGKGYELTVPPEGYTIVVTKAGGCGCSSPLKRWAGPFTPMRFGT